MSQSSNSKLILTILLLSLFSQPTLASTKWRTMAPGIDYTELHPHNLKPLGKIHAFKVDLTKYKLALGFAKDFEQSIATVHSFAKKTQSLITTNGGFFTPSLEPLGLRIHNRKVKNPLKSISWWGVFYTLGDHAYVVPSRSYKPNNAIDFAIQGGPRLIVNGHIPRLKAGRDQRTALGITREGDIIILVTDNLAMTTTELAHLMRRNYHRGGLNCLNALNLDGGSSTQMYAHIHKFTVNVVGLTGVTDVVQIVQR